MATRQSAPSQREGSHGRRLGWRSRALGTVFLPRWMKVVCLGAGSHVVIICREGLALTAEAMQIFLEEERTSLPS